MKVSINWLKELVKINKPLPALIQEINMKTIGTKEVTDKFIELDMKGYNRADLLSLRGVAYEVAALLGSEVKFGEPEESEFAWIKRKLPEVKIEIKNPDACLFYVLAKIEGLKVENSPKEIKSKLEDSGFRSVNNIADITNIVMLEYGQPLHAFDAGTVVDEKVIVRKASDGEEITTLDGKVRKLTKEDLLITDPEKAIGIAGVMGGENTEITGKTNTVLLEAAIFDPSTLRKTATRLGLQSEAGKRFYHGLTKKRLLQALNSAICEFEKLGGRLIAVSIFDKYEDKNPAIKLRVEKTNSLIGLDFKPEEVKKLLERLNFLIKEEKPRVFEVKRPYYRLDITIEEDLIEEVARMYGYDKIPSKELPGGKSELKEEKVFEFIDMLKKQLMHLGLSEIQTYSFYSTKTLSSLGFSEDKLKFLIKLANPISKESEYLRMNIWPNLVESAVLNNKNFEDVAIFEVGKVYSPGKDKPIEKLTLGIALINGSDNPMQELLKLIYSAFSNLKVDVGFGDSKLLGEAKNLFHPLRFKSIIFKGNQIGGVAELHPLVADNMGAKNRIAVCEIDLEKLIA